MLVYKSSCDISCPRYFQFQILSQTYIYIYIGTVAIVDYSAEKIWILGLSYDLTPRLAEIFKP